MLGQYELALLAETIDGRFRALVLVADYGGLRAGELMALRRHRVDLVRRTISITEQGQHLEGEYVVSPPKSADVKVLQRMLGHASAAITLDRCGHLLPGQAESVAERLDEMARAAGTSRLASVQPLDRTGSASTSCSPPSPLQRLLQVLGEVKRNPHFVGRQQ